jgi:8-oxo-dGTP diphosphatase
MQMINEDAERKKAAADGISNFGTGIAVLKDGKLLVVRRVKDDFLGGMYELPGGSVDEGETIEQGAIRELSEETGLKVTEFAALFQGFDYKKQNGVLVRQYNFVVEYPGGEVKLDPGEHDDYKWIRKSEIKSLPNTEQQSRTLFAVPGISD